MKDAGGSRYGDPELLAAVAAAVRRFDPVPQAVREAAQVALGWQSLDAELEAMLAAVSDPVHSALESGTDAST